MNMMHTSNFLMLILTLSFLMQIQCYYLRMGKRINQKLENNGEINPIKRPFCNAFTGCGKKRSALPLLESPSEEQESISSLFELNAEPAVENLSRQIMSEAKLWEAIREANVELERQKQKLNGNDDFNSNGDEEAIRARSATASCALPPCII